MTFFLAKDGTIKPIDILKTAQIGSGGMGSVWQIGNRMGTGNLVAKIYHNATDPKTPSEQKLLAMIDNPPDHVQEVINGVRYTQFAWPQYLIKDENLDFVGFAMPELDFSHSISLNPFMYPREATQLTEYQNSLNYRVQLGANISALMADLHRHGHAFIDFKEQNLRLIPEPLDGKDDVYKGFIVGFVDCDSFLITDRTGHRYPCTVISPEMTSPEYHQHKDITLLDEKHDRFVLAIELFKILNYGIHPFYFIPLSQRLKELPSRVTDNFIKEKLYAYGVTPHPELAPLKNSLHECWDDGTRALFDRAFLVANPNDRPTAQEWESHLRGLSRNRQFTVCSNFPDEVSHIHFVGKSCHRCLLTATQTPNSQKRYANSPYQSITNDEPADINPTALQNTALDERTPTQPAPLASSVWQQPATDGKNKKGADVTPNAEAEIAEIHAPTNDQQRQNAISADIVAKTTATPIHDHRTPTTSASTATVVPPADFSGSNVPLNSVPLNSATAIDSNTIANNQPSVIAPAIPTKKAKKWWLVPATVVALGGLGYGFSQILTGMNQDKTVTVDNKDKPKPKPTTPDKAKPAEEQPVKAEATVDLTTFAGIQKNLPTAVATINEQLAIINQDGGGKRMTARSASDLYAKTLDISPDFFSAVVSAGDKGESDLAKLQQLAFNQEIDQTLQYSQSAFRGASMGYFERQPTNKALAKQLNDVAKTQYWTKKNPQSALYLQAQAVKNYPTQSEYSANLAYYLYKNNYPYSKSFMLYALQTPREAGRYANPFMLEVASSMAQADGNDKNAVGSLLAQFYTADDKEKRCANMLRYPVTNPDLVASAETALNAIAKQHEAGAYNVPTVCLPPYQWASP